MSRFDDLNDSNSNKNKINLIDISITLYILLMKIYLIDAIYLIDEKMTSKLTKKNLLQPRKSERVGNKIKKQREKSEGVRKKITT